MHPILALLALLHDGTFFFFFFFLSSFFFFPGDVVRISFVRVLCPSPKQKGHAGADEDLRLTDFPFFCPFAIGRDSDDLALLRLHITFHLENEISRGGRGGKWGDIETVEYLSIPIKAYDRPRRGGILPKRRSHEEGAEKRTFTYPPVLSMIPRALLSLGIREKK